MKFNLVIDSEREEEVIVYCHKKTALTDAIEQLLEENSILLGYTDTECKRLEIADIFAFSVENGKVFAVCEESKYRLKERLYKIEEQVSEFYVKINQSCIVNIKKIDSFISDASGTLKVRLKNGYTDYVSRRNLKSVKERLGL